MHVDIAERAEFRAFAAADAPVFNDDLQVFLTADGSDRALRHAERVAAGAAGGGDEILVVAQAVADEARHAVVSLGAGAHAQVAARATVEVDE